MIIENGVIFPRIVSGGGFDAKRNPIPVTESWGDPIRCHVKVNHYNGHGKANGNTFTVASYEILIDDIPFDATVIKIEQDGKQLGQHSILSAQRLHSVGAIKIMV